MKEIDFFSYDFYRDNYSFEEHEKYVSSLENKIQNMRNFQEAIKFINQERLKNSNIVSFSDNVYFGIDNGDTLSVKGKNKFFIPTEVILPLKKIKFEGFEYWTPNKPHEYLSFRYDDIYSYPDDLGYSKHVRRSV